MINTRYAAANRDERHFECPEKIDLDAPQRRAATWLLDRASIIVWAPRSHVVNSTGASGPSSIASKTFEFVTWRRTTLRHHPNFALRALKALHIAFTQDGP